MLSDHPVTGRFARADNVVAVDGTLRTRPGLMQVSATPTARALAWGARLVSLGTDGRLRVFDGAEHVVDEQPLALQTGAAFQELSSGVRYDTFFFSDGRSLRSLRKEATGYVIGNVENTVLDAEDAPYPIDAPPLMAHWRGRLWLSIPESNLVRHSELEAPRELDPLYTLEFQGARADRLRAMCPHADTLAVGLGNSLWLVSGYSQYDFVTSLLVDGRGPVGRDAMVSDGTRLFYVSMAGVCQLGVEVPLTSPDLEETFAQYDPTASLALSGDGRWLWCVHLGVQYVLDTSAQNAGWTTLDADAPAAGVVRTLRGAVRYGTDGIWFSGQALDRDRLVSGQARPVALTIETWDDMPNRRGYAVLDRVFEVLRAPFGATVTTRVLVDGVEQRVSSAALAHSGEPAPADLSLWDGDLRARAVRPVQHEFSVGRSGKTFRLRMESNDAVELLGYELRQRGGV